MVNCDYGNSERFRTTEDLIRLAETYETDATLVAGTIETIGGRQVGRVQLALRNHSGQPISRDGLTAFLAELETAGVVTKEVSA